MNLWTLIKARRLNRTLFLVARVHEHSQVVELSVVTSITAITVAHSQIVLCKLRMKEYPKSVSENAENL